MKVIDSFMFSEPHERELLLLKFEMENDIVDEWVAIEGSYTFQGEYKGHYLTDLLKEDERFLPYKHKITVLEVDKNYNRLYLMSPLEYVKRCIKLKIKKYNKDLVALSEEAGFFAEKNQREMIIDYLYKYYSDDDYLILTDVDEMLDATDAKKKESFRKVLSSNESCFKVRRKVFIYDFNNLSTRKRFIPIINIACIKKLKVKSGIAQFIKHRLIWEGMKEIELQDDLFYEFSYCFDKSKIIRKARTFAHAGRGESEFERALLCNHSNKNISMIDQDFINNQENWFEKIEVNNKNLPSLIIDKFEQIRTNAVAENYKEMRQLYYGYKFQGWNQQCQGSI